ncbi:MurR/RpiR family transcriptional regulator [Leifsonia sp. NCR5]|uniref:MurR/RpiR family transcriptional regulator n=1 Tax=Leifsonia sp. NCR5 TaxID=1978342 RepID=UPI000A18F671|nr:MurR/RpiR family transcriptional regulator [Leifsonia sp. NCR5]
MSKQYSVPGQSILARIRSLLPTLSPSEARVALFILEHPDEVIHMTVGEVAERAGSGESTTVRCCRTLGFSGFQDLKISLARETTSLTHFVYDQVDPSDAPGDVLVKVMSFSAQVISDASSSIDPLVFEEAVSVIGKASEVLIIGYGASYQVARSAHDQFASIGIKVSAPLEFNLKYLESRTIAEDACCLVISHTGATRESIRCLDAVRSRGVPTIAITSFPRSRLADRADYSLIASGRELSFRFEALSGRLTHLAVVDALYLALARADPDRARASLDIFHEVDASWQL